MSEYETQVLDESGRIIRAFRPADGSHNVDVVVLPAGGGERDTLVIVTRPLDGRELSQLVFAEL